MLAVTGGLWELFPPVQGGGGGEGSMRLAWGGDRGCVDQGQDGAGLVVSAWATSQLSSWGHLQEGDGWCPLKRSGDAAIAVAEHP